MAKVEICDLVLRDAHQSLLATRMKTEDMLPIAEKLDQVGYWSLEMWGGATFDSCLRFLNENPWERLRALKKAMPNTRMQMLLRGQNILGYKNYPDDVVVKFVEKSAENGIDVFRIFDALNDCRNMEVAIKTAKKVGAHAEATLSYTLSPVHDNDYFVKVADKLKGMGADTICIKDMAGLLSPFDSFDLVSQLVKDVGLPVHMHCHYTSGMASASYLKAVEAGASVLDCGISSMAMGTGHPPTESTVAALRGTGWDTGLDLKLLAEIAQYFREIRKKYKAFESEFTGVDTDVLLFQIPGGMMSNLALQLKEQGKLDKMRDVLAEVPRVRKDLGYPPLVTPTSQIVGTQATLNVIMGERYKMASNEVKNYLKGMYGKAPGIIDEEIRKKVIGDDEVITGRPADSLKPGLEKAREEAGELAEEEEDVLSFAIFPQVAKIFLENRKKGIAPAPEGTGEEDAKGPIAPERFTLVHNDRSHIIEVLDRSTSGNTLVRPLSVIVDGNIYDVKLKGAPVVEPATISRKPAAARAAAPAPPTPGSAPRSAPPPSAGGKGAVMPPMPGKILSVSVAAGDAVTEGQTLLVLEAMKMENEIKAPVAGTIKEVNVKEGQMVTLADCMVVIG